MTQWENLTLGGCAMYKRRIRAIVCSIILCFGVVTTTSNSAFAWKKEGSKILPNGEKLETRIWLGTGNKYDAVSSSWLSNKKEGFEYFKNTLSMYVSGLAVSINASGPNIEGSGTSLVTMSSLSKTNYAGINAYGCTIERLPVLGVWLYVQGKSITEIKHVGQIYSHVENVYKYF